MRTSSAAAHLGKWQRRPHQWQQCHEKQIGCGLGTLWALFFPGRGVKSRLQHWGCVCVPGPQGNYKKIWGTFCRSDTVALCLFFLSHYIFNYQVRREAHYLGEPDPMRLFFFWQQNWTTAICGALDLLMPIANCVWGGNHFKKKQRCSIYSLFCRINSTPLKKILGCRTCYWWVVWLFFPGLGWAACDPPQGLYLISLLAPVWLA